MGRHGAQVDEPCVLRIADADSPYGGSLPQVRLLGLVVFVPEEYRSRAHPTEACSGSRDYQRCRVDQKILLREHLQQQLSAHHRVEP